MEKNDLKNAEKAIKDIIQNSHNLSAAVSVAENLSANLEIASKDYAKIATDLGNVETNLKRDLKNEITKMTSNLDTSIEVKFAEKFSEQAIRMRDLTDEHKQLSDRVQSLENQITTFKKELDTTSAHQQELLLNVKDTTRLLLFVILLGFIAIGIGIYMF